MRYTASTPAMCAAARIAGGTLPSALGGVASTTSFTPATRAGIAVIRTVDGYAARPPGAYSPARRTGRASSLRPGMPAGGGTTWASWNSRMRWAANSRAARSAAASPFAADATSPDGTSNDSDAPGAQPSNRSPYSRSAVSPSAATRAQISCTAALSSANPARSSRRRDHGDSSQDAASKRLIANGHRLAQPRDHCLHRIGARLQARLVGYQARCRRAEHARDAQPVLAQRLTARGKVDDRVDQAHLRSQLDRPVKAHHLDRLAARVEPPSCRARVFGGDAHQRRPRLRTGEL